MKGVRQEDHIYINILLLLYIRKLQTCSLHYRSNPLCSRFLVGDQRLPDACDSLLMPFEHKTLPKAVLKYTSIAQPFPPSPLFREKQLGIYV